MKKAIFFYCIFFYKFLYASEYTPDIKALLPDRETPVLDFEPLAGGMSNNIIRFKTPDKTFVFRYPKTKSAPSRFERILAISQKAARLKLSPEVHGVNNEKQHVLMEHIEETSWPLYTENPQPYHSTMNVLRKYHDAMRPEALQSNPQSFAPFAGTLAGTEKLTLNPEMPEQLHRAYDVVRKYHDETKPWLQENATWYHGDFKLGNVLLAPPSTPCGPLTPWLIDFDSANIGHPYFDVVKFSQKLPEESRLALLQAYLRREATNEERKHFKITDNARRMVVANIRLQAALDAVRRARPDQKLLSKTEMHQLLESTQALPTQSTYSLDDPNPEHQQLAAAYALHEFLRNS